MIPWHRLFGLILDEVFTGSSYAVETEKDLSFRQQRLDVIIIRKRPGEFLGELPDGFAPLADHNLITFKSFQQSFDLWTAQELVGHYVNYRKQIGPSLDELIAPERIRLLGVAARWVSVSEVGRN